MGQNLKLELVPINFFLQLDLACHVRIALCSNEWSNQCFYARIFTNNVAICMVIIHIVIV